MQFVKSEDLKPGMRLARPIYNKLGVLLYERDTKLNHTGIENIKNFELIGIYILEPAEPVPPLSDEDIAFEQFQTISMFQIRKCMDSLYNNQEPTKLRDLVQTIIMKYGSLNHKLNFMQNLRSSADYTYKHAISTAILTAMISHRMGLTFSAQEPCVTAALLYDFGRLFIPQSIIDKDRILTASDHKLITECRKLGYDKLNEKEHEYSLSKNMLKIISQAIYVTDSANKKNYGKITRMTGTKILQVADAFDCMTAMRLDEEPVSELVAIRFLLESPEIFDPNIVSALSSCINILPSGCCVDLSTNEKALVLQDNKDNFMQPIILNFSDNRVYNLSDPEIHCEIQIKDIMKTMDNRIMIDENTLKQFVADENIKKITADFKASRSIPPVTIPANVSAENKIVTPPVKRKKLV